MSKKNTVLIQVAIPDMLIDEMVTECNRRIKQEFKIKNILNNQDDFDWKNYLQNDENIRYSLVNSIVMPVRAAKKGLNPVQIRNYNRLVDTLVKDICENKNETFTISIEEWKLIKGYWEHDGEKIFGTAVLDALTAEIFHEKIFPNIKELTEDDVAIKEPEPEAK